MHYLDKNYTNTVGVMQDEIIALNANGSRVVPKNVNNISINISGY